MSIKAPTSPIEDAALKGLVLSDVDKTLYRTTRAILDGILRLKLKPTPELFYAFACWLMKKAYGREWFSEKVDRIYRAILTQNGPERMEEFYRFVAGKVDLHHDGAVALLQACMNAQLKMVFVTGNDAEYVKIFLKTNGLANANTEIFGGQFEVKDHRYTGRSEGVNMGAEGKAEVVRGLRERYPDVPVVLAMGDDEADLCLFQAAAHDGGICVMVGDDRRLNGLLLENGFSIFKSIEAYNDAESSKKVLQVSARPSPGKITLADVNTDLL